MQKYPVHEEEASKMVLSKMGRYWIKEKGGGFRECGRKSASGSKEVSQMRTCCKSRSYDRIAKAPAVARKRSKPQGVGGKPTNVKTFA